MSKTIKISMILSLLLLTAINFSQIDHSQFGDTRLSVLFNLAIAEDGESSSGCTARTVYDHCGMEKLFENGAFCCKSASSSDMCTMTTYKEC